ncbi:phosphoglycolate phosphatase [Undibacterium sp. Ji83W]|uniref:phosphoglycolate phosphatase n=1 Tax=Undibacterium sp. Ji83W TaxID=3413043 RepID=UPI003BF30EE7
MLSKIKAAIIDLDGTMIDTAPDFLVAINRMREDFALAPLTLDVIKTKVGKGSENLIQQVLSLDFDATGVAARFDDALAAYQRHYLVINGDHSQLYLQVHEGLQAMRDLGLRLVCVTNKPLAFALPLMQKKEILHYFEQVYGGDSFAKKKPDPLPMLEACKALDLPPSQVLAIGDSSNDAIAARAAGCPVLTVPYGYNHGEAVQNIQSDGIVETLLVAAQLLSAKNSH